MQTIVTTSHKPTAKDEALAESTAFILKLPFVVRNRLSLENLRCAYGVDNILLAVKGGFTLHTKLGEYSFHPSMSVPRIKALKEGKIDHLIEAMSLKPGDTVLDCTLGLGADAIVSAFATGERGRVTALESSAELAFMVSQGMKLYNSEITGLKEAMNRIKVIHTGYQKHLGDLPDKAFDIVYFDPMFRSPRPRSSSMQPLCGIVNNEPLDLAAVSDAVRVARNRVVLKDNSFSGEFSRLGFKNIVGGRHSPVAFGIIEAQEAEQ